ncbi:heavy-metal-associated domain-containing protein [Sphingomonas nostoxanthinifaciens]|uniref:heavy-metal-associated domain-containing protein n=1 Tax=Sphingomonas nostoxanthinifaciens TaxID=2872652 RepID=UPI001CC1FB35|nr:heavy-metal-associated domain-containing protein [Sphingomonas nostoxanthinifaciens]UAK25167.1 heavy-metal-associated domain-containing protein [Sphingomonas nostoxanthinifaciens]
MTPTRRISLALGSIAGLGLAALAYAQIEGKDRGVPAIDSSANYEVGGVAVDTSAKTADLARMFGWRLAERRGFRMLWAKVRNAPIDQAPNLSDGQLDAIVAGVSVEDEQIGPTRYIAHLGVLFDRVRAGPLLGVAEAGERSVPMLVVPVMWSGGAPQSFEHRTEWQKAWARFRSGGSPIDYVRPDGSGIDPLVLNMAQVGRPGRGQWRSILDRYGASDIVSPVVQIVRRYPGGPIEAHFIALHGADAEVIARFDLTATDGDALPKLLDEGVRRIDDAYAQALRDGRLHGDSSLSAVPAAVPELPEEAPVADAQPAAALPGATSTFLLQVDTPDDPALLQVQGVLRGIPGVRTVNVDSVALGGVSVMRVAYDGAPDAFRTALGAAGYQAEDSGGGLRIRRGTPR